MLQDWRLRGGYRYLGTILTVSILKTTLLTRTSVLIVDIYKGTFVNLETTGILEYRHRGRKTEIGIESRKLLKARQGVNLGHKLRQSNIRSTAH